MNENEGTVQALDEQINLPEAKLVAPSVLEDPTNPVAIEHALSEAEGNS